MVTPILVLIVTQIPPLGELGESCRSDRDCEAALACIHSVCERKPAPPAGEPSVPAAPPLPVLPPREAPPAVVDEVPPEPPAHFAGIHPFVGVSLGVGPMKIGTSQFLSNPARVGFFDGVAVQVPLELRVGILFGRFEVALEGAPGSTMVTGSTASWLASGSLSLGWLFKIHESADIAVYVPLRARLGLVHQPSALGTGPSGGGSLGVGIRLGRVLLEARGGVTYEMLWGEWSWSALTVPFSAAAALVF